MNSLRNIWLIAAFAPLLTFSVNILRINNQQAFPSAIPPGDYSGITWLGDDRYAVVSDKSFTDGFFIFRISIDSVSGRIRNVVNEGFRSSLQPNRDQEGIAFVPARNTLFVSGESDNRIPEYNHDGTLTGQALSIPRVFEGATTNYGFESLTYNAVTHRFWTTTESTLPTDGMQASPTRPVKNRLRLQSFDDNLQPREQYIYEMDEPIAHGKFSAYAMGVSELCATDDGSLIVLEREFYAPKRKLGAFVNCKLYETKPSEDSLLSKKLLIQFCTRLTLFHFSIANYEGMCLGPSLGEGRRVLILISDSQSRYGGVLKDWFKTIVIDGQ